MLSQAVFQMSAARIGDLPKPAGPEVAFAGRSNAGKSSAINALTGRGRLAFVSKTPGRTQVINFFRLGGGFLVDLPGYGYAKVPETLRVHWHRLIEYYLSYRSSLAGLVLVIDARHPLAELDKLMIQWFSCSSRPLHVLLTKTDKLTRSESRLRLEQAHVELAQLRLVTPVTVQVFSSASRVGVEEARERLGEWLGVGPRTPTKEKAPVKGEKNRGPNALI